jgi:hypothetical protein
MQMTIAQLRPQGTSSLEGVERLEEAMVAQRGRELPGFLNTQVPHTLHYHIPHTT